MKGAGSGSVIQWYGSADPDPYRETYGSGMLFEMVFFFSIQSSTTVVHCIMTDQDLRLFNLDRKGNLVPVLSWRMFKKSF
jgi:hypothetical protein